MKVRPEVIPFLVSAVIVGVVVGGTCLATGLEARLAGGWGMGVGLLLAFYFLYFFRDTERAAAAGPGEILAGADGVIARIVEMREDEVLKTDVVRISIFLSLFNVHVNRAPIAGRSTFLGYFPGKRLFTFQEKSSEVNQHNRILIEGKATRCLVTQIVGPVCRRVVYFLDCGQSIGVQQGDRIGMMKFGSRLDMYFPRDDVKVVSRLGDKVRAGETVVAMLREDKVSCD
jgi:phosphatidylserine decarboxylase